MSDIVYDSKSEALSIAAATLSKASDLPDEIIAALSKKANLVEESSSGAVLPRQLQPALVGRFVIRNDVLLSLETFLSLLKTVTKLVAGFAGVGTPAGIAAITDGIHGLYKAYTEIVAKGYKLTDDQFAVIAALRQLGDATSSEIDKYLQKPLS
ncbi:hypothetical protein [Bradyrhizobium sp. NBAIM14]|uniref:hypothetical protein n=1 Tax=Bradyrhizobium sp. NBAIM14 TaxID=2793814 RepID=UPI001CD5DF0B|nr:hypothetical protein [Bradyrhizobium sp. NBAIM14]MCA1500509.1 hypothetical protein [Bradyrhizobium sp. NBAIM14]